MRGPELRSVRCPDRNRRTGGLPRFGPRPGEWPRTFHFSANPKEEFGYYGGAFLNAARVLNRSLARRKGFKNGDIVPPLFLYRHPVELLTKAVLLPGNELLTYYGEGEATTMIFERFRSWNHRLLPMLNPMQKLLKDVRWAWYWPDSRVETFNDVRAMFRDLDSIDPRAASLRYPVNLKGERSIPVNVVIGLQTTFSSLDDLAEALDTVVLALDAECSQLGFAP